MQLETRYKKGEKIGGRYLVYQTLLGGISEVYLCLDQEKGQPYALKTMQARYFTNLRVREMFQQEAHTWVGLEKHPNVVRCFRMEILDNQPFLLLEWIASDEEHGTDLRSWLRKGPLDLRLALDIVIDICRGLVHANHKVPGIVHRDLKPENILVAQGPLAKVADFGLAAVVSAAGFDVTDSVVVGRHATVSSNGIVGTPAYMAPEQWRGELLDARTDVYALGCILFEMIMGRQCCPSSTLAGCRHFHLYVPAPDDLLPRDLPVSRVLGLERTLKLCLTKAPDQRFPSVSDLLQKLTSIYEQEVCQPPRAVADLNVFTVEDYLNRGTTYTLLSKYSEALIDYNRAIEAEPSFTRAYINRGILYQKLNRFQEALIDCNHAARLDASAPQTYINRGILYSELGKYSEALADFDRSIELDPHLAHGYVNRGALLAKLKRYDAGMIDFMTAIKLDPANSSAYAYRGNMYSILNQYVQALSDLNHAIELDPTNTEAYFSRGYVYHEQQQYSLALMDFSQALLLSPDHALVRCFRGRTYRVLQRYEEALDEYNTAISLDSTNLFFYYSRGNLFDHLGQYQAALTDFNYLIQHRPTHASYYNSRGVIYYNLQDYESAVIDYRRAIELDPDDPEPYFNIGLMLMTRSELSEALKYFEKSSELGYVRGTDYAVLVRERLTTNGNRA